MISRDPHCAHALLATEEIGDAFGLQVWPRLCLPLGLMGGGQKCPANVSFKSFQIVDGSIPSVGYFNPRVFGKNK